MLNISTRLAEEFKEQNVSMFTHEVHVLNLDTNETIEIVENLKPITESIGIDGMPIGKFPIGVLSFQIGGNYTNQISVNGRYEVRVLDTYAFADETEETIVSKPFIVKKIEYDRKTNLTTIEAYDYADKLNVEYTGIERITTPLTFEEFVQEFFIKYGLAVNTSNLLLDTYTLNSLPTYDSKTSALQVARDICKLSLCFAYIDNTNTVRFVNAEQIKTETNNTVITNEFVGLKEFIANSDKFKNQGVNTLVLGLTSDIDSENVSKSNASMVQQEGTIEVRLDNIPFVWNQSLKQEVIDTMFSSIEGFKYKAFESTGKQFYFELGDLVHQEGLGDNSTSYKVLILDKKLVRNGSMITTYGSSSESTAETEYKWSEFTSIKRTEILVDKANQSIVLTNQKVDENGNKIVEIENSIEGIRLEVSRMGGNNIIPNAIGKFGITSWSFISVPFNFRSSAPYAVFNALPIYFINNNGSIMYSVSTTTASKSGFRFWKDGVALSDYAVVEGGSDYSLYTKVKGSGILRFKIREYTSPTPSGKDTYHKETLLATSIVNNSFTTLTNTIQLQTNTVSVVLVVESDVDVYTQQYADFTDTSFNIGAPKAFSESITDMNDRLLSMQTTVTQNEQLVQINANKVSEVEGKIVNQQAQISVQANEISQKVSRNGIVSAINQTAESIKISASKIDLTGYVTVSSLSGQGTTTIDGSNIKTGTITADKINVTGLVAEKIMSSNDSNYYGEVGVSDGYVGLGLYDLRHGTTPYFQVLEMPTNGFVIEDYNNVRRFSATGAYTRIHHSNNTISFDSTTSGTRIVFGNSEIGIDNTGPYYIKSGGSKVYF